MTALTPMKAIRAKCLDCCVGNSAEVRKCHIETCSLHPFRFGKNPFRQKRVLTEEQKQAVRHRLEKGRARSLQNKGA